MGLDKCDAFARRAKARGASLRQGAMGRDRINFANITAASLLNPRIALKIGSASAPQPHRRIPAKSAPPLQKFRVAFAPHRRAAHAN